MYYLILPTLVAAVFASGVVSAIKTEAKWLPDQARSALLSDKGFCRLESVTLDEIAARGGILMPPVRYGDLVNGAAYSLQDGGLDAYLGARYRFQPRTMDEGQWRYGQVLVNGAATAYVCLDATSVGVSEGTFRALQDMQSKLAAGRFFISSSCGDLTNITPPSAFPSPVAVTLTVIPGTRVLTSCGVPTANGNNGGSEGATPSTPPAPPESPVVCKEKPGHGHHGNSGAEGKRCKEKD